MLRVHTTQTHIVFILPSEKSIKYLLAKSFASKDLFQMVQSDCGLITLFCLCVHLENQKKTQTFRILCHFWPLVVCMWVFLEQVNRHFYAAKEMKVQISSHADKLV